MREASGTLKGFVQATKPFPPRESGASRRAASGID